MSLTLILAQDYLPWKHANIVLSGQVDLSINGWAADRVMPQKGWHLKFVACALVLVALTGCLYPHTSPRSPEICGKILDARTHAPVRGAEVFLSEHPKFSSTSDAAGHFRLKATRNFHLCAGLGCSSGGGWPRGQYWEPHISVSHSNYIPREVGGDFTDKGNILLEPKQR
jgi:hypothetical protein